MQVILQCNLRDIYFILSQFTPFFLMGTYLFTDGKPGNTHLSEAYSLVNPETLTHLSEE